MVIVKNVKENKIFCWDCGIKIEIEKEKIKNGKMLEYEGEKEKIKIFKCEKCFQKNKELKNYQPCEVYSRVVGYLRPVQEWNLGKKEEFKKRKLYKI